ncbi:HlyD family secretion protein [Clostridium aminobutyricum]|uniref:HlyD family efflux transporter periplasmic adaptor subunit n=1 Tax=Clostridium aminobutyricum TaxID=33953 RepID=A0A939IJA1_CLOAM|nr:biotin/lipoyl-binding protein [Clostridium aminobutyricum]MBN7773891.1 HlyD family efflux transporter periplasmic adaptor subunit [Clostridium aminobutyricum]
MGNQIGIHGKKEKIKKVVMFIVIVLIISIIAIYFQGKQKGGIIGEVESAMVTHASEVSGKIVSCPVQLGSPVKTGDVIAVIDDTSQRYMVEQLELNVQKAQLAIGSTTIGKGGTADNNYSAAKAAYKNAQASLSKASEDYRKAQDLFAGAAISKERLDTAKLAYDSAASALEGAKSSLDNITDQTASNSANLDVALLQSQLVQQQENLEKYTITASCDGTIMSLNYKQGDMVQLGYDVADVSDASEKYAVFYFPKDHLQQLTYDKTITVYLPHNAKQDSKSVEGIIKFIDVKSEYTPKDLQTSANKNRESVKVKALLPADCSVNPGQEVRIDIDK